MILTLLLGCAAEPTGPWTEARALAPTLGRMDKDGDGRVTAAEYAPVSFGGPAFAQADADGDGDLELAELAALDASLDPLAFYESPKLALGGGGPGQGGGPPPGGPSKEGAPPPGGPSKEGGSPPGGPGQEGGPPPGGPGQEGGPPPGGPGKEGGPPPGGPGQPGRAGQPQPGSANSELHDVRWILLTLRDEVEEAAPTAALPTREQIEVVGTQELTSQPVQALLTQIERAADQHGVAFPASLRAR